MTPWLRTLRATGLAGALGAGAVVAPCAAGPAHGAGLPASAPVAVVAAPSPGPSAPGAVAVPDGSGTHDGRGGHARPGRPDGHDRTERPDRPDAGPSSLPAEDSGPGDGPGRRPPKSSSPSSSATSAASPSESGTADPGPSRGGRQPGEGRQRPGRDEERRPERDGRGENADRYPDDDSDVGVPEAPATATPPGATEAAEVSPATPSRSPAQSGTPTRAAAEPVLRVLPLGSGLVLIGLGLALGLAGLRLRRG
ncbi:hypothetical protein GUR47_20750 [Streptomyces tendae]|uniref:Uncharacterized protein n=1 Tax=Streptomyces tendae TaxID=1932 RepID=A0A6B3QM93_STRTE|nr:hypothetical protein [Streptomyces tendae]NEV89082.1 hypothetical protein [Streptomyces tendae]